MSQEWLLVLLLWGMTAAVKSFGPVVFGGRQLPPGLQRINNLVPSAVLAALVALQTATTGPEVVADARIAGMAAAIGLLAWKKPLWTVMAGAVVVTAALRWIGV
ncbi:MAG: AzlD domain-containing protein [Actinomycetes bacterium]|jgi:branched-subunit amino acid transport protein|nr:MAG: branched-chain amino acid transporter AzlD [Actinomycetota bacterium]